jgi:hypothetical protein
VQFYTRIYSEQLSSWSKLDGLSYVLGRLWMERAFEKSGIFEIVKALNGYKVPGQKGFSLAKS